MARGKQVLVAAEEFSNEPFESIAENGLARFFGDGDAQTSDAHRVAADYDGKETRTSSDPLFVNNPIAAFVSDLFRSSERLCFHSWKPAIRKGR